MSIFVTCSPDEGHQMLYIRLARTRCSDPVRRASALQDWDAGAQDYPPLDDNYMVPVHVETFCRALPTWEQSRKTRAARSKTAKRLFGRPDKAPFLGLGGSSLVVCDPKPVLGL